MKNTPNNLSNVLRRHANAFSAVLDTDLNADCVCTLDFSERNLLLQKTDLLDTQAFNAAVNLLLQQQEATIGVGGYMEDRFIYRRSRHFDVAAQSRNLHLGIDVWAPAGTAVFAPLEATVHSFKDNDNFGDYGPTIILQHELDGVAFYTLYGHLNRQSLVELEVGQRIEKGQQIAEVGPFPENGHWPPHLHFQIIADMHDKYGDFPGVATLSERGMYEQLCPNPNLILQCRHLPL